MYTIVIYNSINNYIIYINNNNKQVIIITPELLSSTQ